MRSGYEHETESSGDVLPSHEKTAGAADIASTVLEKFEHLESRIAALEKFMVFFDCTKLDRLMELVGTVDNLSAAFDVLKLSIEKPSLEKAWSTPRVLEPTPEPSPTSCLEEVGFDPAQMLTLVEPDEKREGPSFPATPDLTRINEDDDIIDALSALSKNDTTELGPLTSLADADPSSKLADSRSESKTSSKAGDDRRRGSKGNGDALIDRREFGSVLRKLKNGWTDKQLDQLFQAADTGKTGRINLDEFLHWVFPELIVRNPPVVQSAPVVQTPRRSKHKRR